MVRKTIVVVMSKLQLLLESGVSGDREIECEVHNV